jgi:class 3 adenylate cyclase
MPNGRGSRIIRPIAPSLPGAQTVPNCNTTGFNSLSPVMLAQRRPIMSMSVSLSGSSFEQIFDAAHRSAAAGGSALAGASAHQAFSATLNAERYPFAACVMSDAEHFTEVTEGMDPCEVVELIRVYFNALFAPVFKYGGRVIDVKGDGILAVWIDCTSERLLRNRVCSACLEMAEAVDDFNAAHPRQRLPTRIGVDVGPIALADLGALACLQRRAVGDPVVTSSRLEQLNKELGTRILVSAAVAQDEYGHVFRDVGTFRLRGKRSDLRVLELVGHRDTVTARQRKLCRGFADAIAAYEAGDREAAAMALRRLQSQFPEDGATRYYAQRCAGVKEPRLHPGLQRIATSVGLSLS